MSTVIMSMCWPLQMPPSPKSVLVSLADNANDQGECWPSIPTICERTCLGRTAVIEAIKWLEQAGYLYANRDSGRHTRYTILVENGELFPTHRPVRQADRSATHTSPASGLNPSGRRTTPVRQADSNRKEPSRTVSKKKSAPAAQPLACPDDVSNQVWLDWLALRKAKRAPVTETVVSHARKEAGKAGLALEDFLRVWCARGSQGLEADWLKPNERNNGGRSSGAHHESAADRAARLAKEGDERERRSYALN